MDRSGDAEKVVHPKHYNSHPSGIEAWDVCEQLGFNVGNAVKYLFRVGLKEGESQDVDLKKARAYLVRESERASALSVRANGDLIDLMEEVVKSDPSSVIAAILVAWLNAPIREDKAAKACLQAFDLVTDRKYVP